MEEPNLKMNRKLIDKTTTTDDVFYCSNFSDLFSCCCFFLYA